METLPPALVASVVDRARAAGVPQSGDLPAGRLLAVLAAHVPPDGRVLELGTGIGLGTAWIRSGLGSRTDVTVITIEPDPALAALAAESDWPDWVDARVGDPNAVLDHVGTFDLVVVSAMAGAGAGLDRVVGALIAGGLLVVDGVTPQPHWSQQQRTQVHALGEALLAHPLLTSVGLDHGTGLILGTRHT